ncbi:MAG: DUF4388 domain-containing protein, partial [Fibrobacterota bacterium]
MNSKLVHAAFLFFTLIHVLHAADSAQVQFYGKLVRRPDSSAKLVTVLNDKCPLKVLSARGRWLEVQSGGYRGWILRSQTTFRSPADTASTSYSETGASLSFPVEYAVIGGGAVLIALIVSLLSIRFSRRRRSLTSDVTGGTRAVDKQDSSSRKVLIFSRKDKSIKSSVSNIHKRLSTSFREMGFCVMFTQRIRAFSLSVSYRPELIVVDCDLENKAVTSIERLVSKGLLKKSATFLFYNVPDPAAVDPGRQLESVFFLGREFSERDILKIASQRLSLSSGRGHLLQGRITGEGIFEIVQLIHSGKKTGVLKITDTAKRVVGLLHFRKGLILLAKTARTAAREAALEILSLKEGFFSFREKVVEEKNCNIDPQAIIMEAARIEDEIFDFRTVDVKK